MSVTKIRVPVLDTTTLNTDGKGYWTNKIANVRIAKIVLMKETDMNHLRVYFYTQDWDTYKDGLIYTDRQFGNELRVLISKLLKKKISSDQLTYSEQGMQTATYVDFDIDEHLVNSLVSISNKAYEKWRSCVSKNVIERTDGQVTLDQLLESPLQVYKWYTMGWSVDTVTEHVISKTFSGTGD